MHYVVGDVHGAGAELVALLEKVKFLLGRDHLCLVGDVFDRGLRPGLVWDAIHALNPIMLEGNHERKMRNFLIGKIPDVPTHYHFALQLLEQHGVTRPALLTFLNSLPLVVEFGGIIVAHAGVNLTDPLRPDADANIYGHLRADEPSSMPPKADGKAYWFDQYEGDRLVIYGHLVSKDGLVRVRRNSIGIDTAACHGGPLTAYCVETGEIIQYQSGHNQWIEVKRRWREQQSDSR